MKGWLRHPIRENLFSKGLLALNVLLWLLWLPVVLRIYCVPTLLTRISGRTRDKLPTASELEQAIGIVSFVCGLRAFRLRLFPQRCLRQSLTLYRALSRMGFPVEIHFGVVKNQDTFRAHSWVTLEGQPVADTAHSGSFKRVYSYSALGGSSNCSSGGSNEEARQSVGNGERSVFAH